MYIAHNITELIGRTPLLQLNSLQGEAKILGKCEFLNPGGSVKDRIGLNMLQESFARGEIQEGSTIIEPTSGNTGIALAMICAQMGLSLILTMPSSMSLERRKLLKAFGARLELTPPEQGMQGAIDRAHELAIEIPNAQVLQQFSNNDNPSIHRETTAREILQTLEGNIDIFVTGVGTGGTLTGVGEVLKAHLPSLQIIAVEPSGSAVLENHLPGPHKIQGIGAGFIPEVLNQGVYDEVIAISDEDAARYTRHIALNEGILVGISSGANLYAAEMLAKRPENRGKTIVTMLCDTGERYLSTDLFTQETQEGN